MATRKQLPPEIRKRWAAVIRKDAKDLKKHFKRDKWPLDLMGAASFVATDVLGVDLTMLYWQELIKQGYQVNFDPKKVTFLFSVKKAKRGKRK